MDNVTLKSHTTRQSESTVSEYDDVDFGKAEVVGAVKHAAHNVKGFVHRGIGDTDATLHMLDRLNGQVSCLTRTVEVLSESVNNLTRLNMDLLATISALQLGKKKSK